MKPIKDRHAINFILRMLFYTLTIKTTTYMVVPGINETDENPLSNAPTSQTENFKVSEVEFGWLNKLFDDFKARTSVLVHKAYEKELGTNKQIDLEAIQRIIGPCQESVTATILEGEEANVIELANSYLKTLYKFSYLQNEVLNRLKKEFEKRLEEITKEMKEFEINDINDYMIKCLDIDYALNLQSKFTIESEDYYKDYYSEIYDLEGINIIKTLFIVLNEEDSGNVIRDLRGKIHLLKQSLLDNLEDKKENREDEYSVYERKAQDLASNYSSKIKANVELVITDYEGIIKNNSKQNTIKIADFIDKIKSDAVDIINKSLEDNNMLFVDNFVSFKEYVKEFMIEQVDKEIEIVKERSTKLNEVIIGFSKNKVNKFVKEMEFMHDHYISCLFTKIHNNESKMANREINKWNCIIESTIKDMERNASDFKFNSLNQKIVLENNTHEILDHLHDLCKFFKGNLDKEEYDNIKNSSDIKEKVKEAIKKLDNRSLSYNFWEKNILHEILDYSIADKEELITICNDLLPLLTEFSACNKGGLISEISRLSNEKVIKDFLTNYVSCTEQGSETLKIDMISCFEWIPVLDLKVGWKCLNQLNELLNRSNKTKKRDLTILTEIINLITLEYENIINLIYNSLDVEDAKLVEKKKEEAIRKENIQEHALDMNKKEEKVKKIVSLVCNVMENKTKEGKRVTQQQYDFIKLLCTTEGVKISHIYKLYLFFQSNHQGLKTYKGKKMALEEKMRLGYLNKLNELDEKLNNFKSQQSENSNIKLKIIYKEMKNQINTYFEIHNLIEDVDKQNIIQCYEIILIITDERGENLFYFKKDNVHDFFFIPEIYSTILRSEIANYIVTYLLGTFKSIEDKECEFEDEIIYQSNKFYEKMKMKEKLEDSICKIYNNAVKLENDRRQNKSIPKNRKFISECLEKFILQANNICKCNQLNTDVVQQNVETDFDKDKLKNFRGKFIACTKCGITEPPIRYMHEFLLIYEMINRNSTINNVLVPEKAKTTNQADDLHAFIIINQNRICIFLDLIKTYFDILNDERYEISDKIVKRHLYNYFAIKSDFENYIKTEIMTSDYQFIKDYWNNLDTMETPIIKMKSDEFLRTKLDFFIYRIYQFYEFFNKTLENMHLKDKNSLNLESKLKENSCPNDDDFSEQSVIRFLLANR